jgi:hypothetical protein
LNAVGVAAYARCVIYSWHDLDDQFVKTQYG